MNSRSAIFIGVLGIFSLLSDICHAQKLSDAAARRYLDGSLWTAPQWEYENFLVRQGVASEVSFGGGYIETRLLRKYPELTDLISRAHGFHTTDLHKIDARIFRPGDNGIIIFDDMPYVRAQEASHALGHVDGYTQHVGDGLDRLREEIRVSKSHFSDTPHGRRMIALMAADDDVDIVDFIKTDVRQRQEFEKELAKLRYMKKSQSDFPININTWSRPNGITNLATDVGNGVGVAGLTLSTLQFIQPFANSSRRSFADELMEAPGAVLNGISPETAEVMGLMANGTYRTIGNLHNLVTGDAARYIEAVDTVGDPYTGPTIRAQPPIWRDNLFNMPGRIRSKVIYGAPLW